MQIIDTGVFGTRSAVTRLRRRDTALQFVVFPMIHVASPRFFAEVTKRLCKCQVLVVEGVSGRSTVAWAITASYRIIPKNRSSGLVEDNIPYQSLGVPLVTPDVDGAEFDASWRTMRLRTRVMMWCVMPFVVVGQFLGGRRRLLAPNMALDDDDVAENEVEDELDQVFGGERDHRLLAALTELHETRSAERIDVAVVYGAAHVGPLVQALAATLGYVPRESEWLTVLEA